MSDNLKHKKYWLVIAFFFLWLIGLVLPRFYLLSIIPPTLVHDEVVYVGTAKALAVSGKGLTGEWSPWSLTPPHVLYAELPAVLMAVPAYFFDNSLLAARFAQALLGSLLPLVLGWIVFKLFNKSPLAVLTVVLTAINPWFFQFSRLSFDTIFSVFFYLLGLAWLLQFNGSLQLGTLGWWFIGFYQYQGLKVIFLPLTLISLIFRHFQSAASTHKVFKLTSLAWPLLVITLGVFFIFGTFVVRLGSQTASNRLNDVIFLNQKYLARLVNEKRSQTIANPLTSLVSNKATVAVREFSSKYVQAFDPRFLFFIGENVRNPFTVWNWGVFYPLDGLLIVIGLISLWANPQWRKQAMLITGFILIAPLPLAINSLDSWYMFRAAWVWPWLVVLSALGWDTVWQQTSVTRTQLGSIFSSLNQFITTATRLKMRVVLVGVYVLLVGNFFYDYVFHYPLISTKGPAQAERVMANFIYRALSQNSNQHIVVLTSETDFVFTTYLVLNKLITATNILNINQAFKNENYTLGSVTFANKCLDQSAYPPDTIIINSAINPVCENSTLSNSTLTPAPQSAIASLLDSGAVFFILNDTVCDPTKLPGYPSIKTLNDFDIENLNLVDFCQRFVSKR